MADISASFTQHHHSVFYLAKVKVTINFNLQDLSSLWNLNHLQGKATLLKCFQ